MTTTVGGAPEATETTSYRRTGERSLPPGDRLRLRSTVLQARLLKSRPGVGLLLTRWELFNQHGALVMAMEGHGMVACRGTPGV